MQERTSLVALNRGLISRFAVARIDLKRIALAATILTNWLPKVLGAMILRPGWQYIFGILGNQACRYLKFIFATNDTSLLELTPLVMRVSINDVLLTRPAVTTAVTNGTFAVNLASWTSNDEAGAVSQWVAPGYMELVGASTTRAIRDQQVTCVNPTVEHALRIVVVRGPVTLRVGTALDDDSYVTETTLYTGTHSISFTPTSDFWIRFASGALQKVWISNCTIEAAGVVTLPTPWTATDLSKIRYDQSADVMFVACPGFQQRRIERRGTRPAARSWSVVLYLPPDGPFAIQNTSPLTLTPSALTGNITVTASRALFKSTHVGALFSITSIGQQTTLTSAASATSTPSIRVTGIDAARVFSVIISGDATGSTVDLQRSYDNATWANVGAPYSWTANNTSSVNDTLANQIVYYRLTLTTRVAPDTVTMTLTIGSGSIRGVFRVTDYTTSVLVNAEVLVSLGGVTASTTWQEGIWSSKKGWPTSVRLHEGRLWWAGMNGIVGSVSDAFDSFDETLVGDAGPINRTIGSGPVDTINWMLSMRGMILGAQGAEWSARSSSLDEPLTRTNFNLKSPSTQGSGAVEALKVDQLGYFVDRAATKVFELAFDVKLYDYGSIDLMELVPELGIGGIVRMDVQRKPDTRLHCVRADGTVLICVMNRTEDVLAWTMVTTSGSVEDVVVLPAISGNTDDQVYYVVKRTINGSTVRYLEKWALEIDCRGDLSYCNLADAYVKYSGVATKFITGLSHLEGQQVVVWADGADVGTIDTARPWTQTYTVSGGQITLATPASNVTVGLGYTAQFQSMKLGSISQAGSPLSQQKQIPEVGLVLVDTHPKGIKFGPTLDDTGPSRMDDMPSMEKGAPVGTATRVSYDDQPIPFPGTWTTDLRVCLQAQAPRPAGVLGITPEVEAH